MTVDPVSHRPPQPAVTAGEEDHSDPRTLTGEPADAPEDTGRPPAEVRDQRHEIDSVLLLPEDRS